MNKVIETLSDGTNIVFNTIEDVLGEDVLGEDDIQKLQIEFSKEFESADVEVSIKVNGDILNLKSRNYEAGFQVTKRF